jgi:hypothetical protein
MPRKTTTNPAIFDRVHYSNPQIIADWKKKFSAQTPQKEQAVGKTITKAPRQAKPIEKPARKAPAEKPQTNGEVLAFIQQFPATFQLNRREQPADFECMSFVLKALSTDPTRPYFTVLHVEQTQSGSRLVATDGHRLHVAEIAARIAEGNYKPHITKDTISLGEPDTDIQFPNWAAVVPDNTEKRGVINLNDTGMGKNRKQNEKLSIAFNDFLRFTGETVNLRFLDDLPKREWGVYCQSKQHTAIMLKEEGATTDTYAVLMPLGV